MSGAETPATMIPPDELAETLARYFVEKIREYAREHYYKFCGVGMTRKCVSLSPQLPAKLWSELDIVPFVFDQAFDYPTGLLMPRRHHVAVDEEADSMARKCLMYVSPTRY
jgi:alpha,alpha-trehalose phosphorylase (configuration-retaining)